MTKLAHYHKQYSMKNNPAPYAIAAGGVVYRKAGDVYQYLLLVRIGTPSTYHLPKGTLHIDETLEACALREIQEESAAKTQLTDYIGATTRQFINKGVYCDKTVHYYAAKFIESIGSMDNEHDDVEWCSYESAVAKLAAHKKQEQIFIERCDAILHNLAK